MSIDQRLERLERQVRIWQIALAICIVIIITIMSEGGSIGPSIKASEHEAVAKSIRTRSLIIVDEDDKPVGWFESIARGICSLHLGDATRSDSQIILQSFPTNLPPGAENSPLFTPFTITSKKGRVGLSSARVELGIWNDAKKREQERVLERVRKGTVDLSNLDKRDDEILSQPAYSNLVTMGAIKSGGVIDVLNSYEKTVVSIQSNKNSNGAVYLSDVNGMIQKPFVAD
jgi:hypothetical protein